MGAGRLPEGFVEGHVSRSSKTVFMMAAVMVAGAVPTTAQVSPDSAVTLDPILVRVLRSTIGTEAPYPVSVVSGAELTRGTASAFLEEALRAVPGIQIHNRFNFAVGERLAVRGFGPRSQFGVRGIRILVDGIPATLPDGQATIDHLDLAGLGRVEVLRGPNAALYGNAAGGVLHFQTLNPALEPASIGARSTTGSNGLWTLEGTASGTAGDVGFRFGVTRTDYDGFRRDPVADDGSAYGAATRSVVNGTVTLPLADGTLRLVANGVDLDAENPGSLPQDVLDEGQRAAWGFNVNSGASKTVRQGQLGAVWSGALGSTTTELAVWGIRRELENPIPGTIIDLDRSAGGVRSLVQGTRPTGVGAFRWGAGFEVELQSDGRLNFENDGGDAGALTLDQHERVRGAGVFVQGRLDLAAGVSLLAGLRYDDIAFSVDDEFVAPGDPDDSGDRTMSAVSPSAGLVVEASESVELFGSVGRSFETPTTTELANRPTGAGGFNESLEPQIGLTLEGGIRSTLGSRVRAEATLFLTQLEDGLVPFEVATDPGRTYFRNAAEADHNGWELSVEASLADGLGGRIAYTHVDAVYDFYETDADVYSGKMVPGLAPNRVDGLLTLDRGPGYLELRGLWQDDVPVDDANSATSPSYFLADVRLGLDELVFGNVDVAPFFAVANLFDTSYNASVVPNAFGSRYFEPGPGRTYRIGLGVAWGG
jgi:iron complex outermembrane recepter protein